MLIEQQKFVCALMVKLISCFWSYVVPSKTCLVFVKGKAELPKVCSRSLQASLHNHQHCHHRHHHHDTTTRCHLITSSKS
ncbi:hypothetical protein Hanom_Chr17g01580151 [Helianthus anomalus]